MPQQMALIEFTTFLCEIDGSASLHTVARIEDGIFSYVNGEMDSTVWPGWF